MCSCKQGTCPGNCPCGCRHTPPFALMTAPEPTTQTEACCEHSLMWHHEVRGCGYHGFSDDRCPCLLTFDEALVDHDATVAAEAKAAGRAEGARDVLMSVRDELNAALIAGGGIYTSDFKAGLARALTVAVKAAGPHIDAEPAAARIARTP